MTIDPEPSVRTRPFYPGDNPEPISDVDWKSRYYEMKNNKDWDPKRDFVGLKRLGDSYHPLDPFFKFEGVPEHMQLFDKMWWPFFGGTGFTISAICANWWSRRPFFSAAGPVILSGIVGTGIGLYAWHNSRRRARERDAVLIHYMLLHEKELPRIERKRFGEITRPWIPFRVGNDGLFVED